MLSRSPRLLGKLVELFESLEDSNLLLSKSLEDTDLLLSSSRNSSDSLVSGLRLLAKKGLFLP
jgi:hypothetical protein